MRFMFVYISAIVLYIPTVHSKARNIWTNRHSRYLCDACVVTAVLHRRVDDGQGVNSYIGQNLLEKEVKSEKAKTINLIMKNISASPGFTLTNVLRNSHSPWSFLTSGIPVEFDRQLHMTTWVNYQLLYVENQVTGLRREQVHYLCTEMDPQQKLK